MKSLSNWENPSSHPLQEAYFGFQIAGFGSKTVPNASCPVIPKIVANAAMKCTFLRIFLASIEG
jgi:hypothetical protein